ncbi:MAG: fibronectin type III domain-containing protein [Cyclobacteriaceae bacterium]
MVFGGEGANGIYNTLRKFDFSTDEWISVSGDESPYSEGLYEEINVSSTEYAPRARKNAGSVEDSNGNIWIFGGVTNTDLASPTWMNDLWMYNPKTNEWTLKKGNNDLNNPAEYGSAGVAGIDNIPGAREGAYIWIDDQDIIWLFGGLGLDSQASQGYLNDFWKYDITTGQWTWVSGSNLINQPGVYGQLNVASQGNLPGARSNGLFWKDQSGVFWLFGGFGYDKFGRASGHLNDHWSFDLATETWTWHAGSNFRNSTGVYNEKGTTSTEFIPGARRDGSVWVGEDNSLWMFGGSLINRIGTGLYSDFWKYEIDTEAWTWYNGKNSTTDNDDVGVYGEYREGSTPHPNARHGGVTWTDNRGAFWVLGGSFFNGGSRGFLNDLWKYEPNKATWEYIRGSSELILNDGVYGSIGVSNPANEPKSRWHGASWVAKDDKLWFFGGINRNQVTQDVAWLNDLWVYDPASNVYTWMGGSSSIGGSGRYGTKGVPSAANVPGARSSSVDWVDKDGNFWLFGGYENFEYNNDLWKYNPNTRQWTWINGNSFQNTPGIYGEKGVPNKSNEIGARRYSDSWVAEDGKVWIFGGQGIDENAQLGYLNDLWMYDPETNIWTWMNGKSTFNDPGNFGEKGVESADNLPPSRYAHATWLDDSGNLWLMGGYTVLQDGENLYVDQTNDIWKYNIRTNNWVWIGGDKLPSNESVRGVQGSFSEEHSISGRERSIVFETTDKSFYIFGGRTESNVSLGDFWQIKFKPGEPFVVLDDALGQEGFSFTFDEPWALNYKIQVSANDEFTDNLLDRTLTDSQISITDLTPGTEYYYRVDAVNDIGNSGFGRVHQVLTLPATPEFVSSTASVTDITPESAFINWDETPGILDSYEIQISLDSTFTNLEAILPGYENKRINNSLLSEPVNGLIAGTLYYVRLRSVNASGNSPYSEVIKFLTAPKTPTLLRVNSVTESTARISWAPVAEIYDNYQLLLSTDSTFGNPESVVDSYNFLEIGKENNGVELVGLVIGTNYYLRLFTENTSGISYPSQNLSVLTLPESPFFVDDEAVLSVTQNSIEIKWETPSEIYDGFLLEVSTDESFVNPSLMLENYGKGSQPAIFSKEITSEFIDGLLPGRQYFARVRSFNASGESKNSNTLELLTIPDKPDGIRVSNIDQTSATLLWSAPKGEETFLIDVNTSPDFDEETQLFFQLPQVFAFQLLSDLSPGTTYYVRIQTRNSSGASGEVEAYDSVSFKTIPATPEVEDLTDFTQSGVTVKWDPVQGANGYFVDVSDNFFQTFIPNFNARQSDGETIEVTGMEAGKAYQIRVRSFNESGQSPNKNLFDVFTLPATPIARDASKVSANSFSINWDPAVGADAYSIEVTANSLPDFIITDTVTSVTPIDLNGLQVGVSYTYRVRAINSSGASPFSDAIEVLTQNSSQSLSIASIDFSDEFTVGTTSLPIIISTTGGFADPVVTLRYKGITESIWSDLVTLTGPNSQTFNFEVTEFMLDEIGLIFEIYATDNFVQLESKNNTVKRVFSETQSEELPELVFSEWQMISIPFVLDDDLVTSVFNELVSLEYKKQWRLMHYQNEVYDDAITGFTRVELGKGYWFYSKNNVSIDVGAGRTNTELPFSMSLVKGWNQIGNPFNSSLNWNAILRENVASAFIDDLNIYNPSDKTFERVTTLEAFQGAFVWSDSDFTLEVFPGGNPVNGRIELSEANEDLNAGNNWHLPLSLTIHGKQQVIAGVGMNGKADMSKDGYDIMVPPRFENYFEMYTTHSDYVYPYFAQDIVPVSDEYVWHFDLESDHMDGRTILEWDDQLLAERNIKIWLVDESTGIAIEMDNSGKYTFDFTGKRHFSIHYSVDTDYQPLPSRLILGDAYPNPAIRSTNIPILLPERSAAYDLEVAVYDLQGKKVAVVAEGKYEAGLHLLEWTSSDDESLAGGIYFYRLSFRNESLGVMQKKLILQK